MPVTTTFHQVVLDAVGGLRRVADAMDQTPDGVNRERILSSIQHTLRVFGDEVDMDMDSAPDLRMELAKFARRLHYQKRRRAVAKAMARADATSKLRGRILSMWLVRAGLSAPSMPLRAVSDFLSDFPRVEVKAISHTYVGQVRDAFCEIIKDKQKAKLRNILEGAAAKLQPGEQMEVVITHAHDEAPMRVRSFVEQPSTLGKGGGRARASLQGAEPRCGHCRLRRTP